MLCRINAILLAVCCALLSSQPYADQSFSAGDLAKICSSKIDDDRSVCLFIVKAYKDGFPEGVANGVMGTYRFDPEITATVSDVKAKDFSPRLNRVIA